MEYQDASAPPLHFHNSSSYNMKMELEKGHSIPPQPPGYQRIVPSENDNEEASKPAKGPELILCKLDVRQWFLIHSIILSILNIPVLVISTFYYGLVIFPFTYNLILLAAAIWRKIPALQTIKVLGWVKLAACVLLFVFVPTAIGLDCGKKSSRFIMYEAFFTALLFEIPVVILTIFILAQMYLSRKVLELEEQRTQMLPE